MRRCLILGCTQKKTISGGILPAVKRYDGPLFKILHHYLRERPEDPPDVYVLSAEFGLIPGDCPTPYYDRKMTLQRAQELLPRTLDELQRIVEIEQYRELYICTGATYRQALAGYEKLIPAEVNVTICAGTSGNMQAKLRDWLYGSLPPPGQFASSKNGHTRIRGVDVALTPEQVFSLARQALLDGKGKPSHYQSWYVLIDCKQVAPKWLVSQITGLPVSAFTSTEARRMLNQLGIEVVRL